MSEIEGLLLEARDALRARGPSLDLLDRIERQLDPLHLTAAQRSRVEAFRLADALLAEAAPLEDRIRLAEWVLAEAPPPGPSGVSAGTGDGG